MAVTAHHSIFCPVDGALGRLPGVDHRRVITRRSRSEQLSHPCIRPYTVLLTRNDGQIQVGLDTDPVLILQGNPGLRRTLELFDGGHSLAAITRAAEAHGICAEELEWLFDTLGRARLLTDGRPPSPFPHGHDLAAAQVRLVGCGSLGEVIGTNLARSGVGQVHLIDRRTPPDTAASPRARALAQRMSESVGTSRDHPQMTVANHWSKPEGHPVDLTIVCTETVEPDRLITDQLLRSDEPHLIVRSLGHTVVVGPLVVPGRTACLRCLDLARRGADPQWPQLLRQLTQVQVGSPAALVTWSGSVALAQVLGYLTGSQPETFSATLELSVTDFLTRWRSWPLHPECGCNWDRAAQ